MATHTKNLRQQLAQSGLANSSFAQEILGENDMQGTQQIANMPADITSSFLGRAVPVVAGTGTNALNTAANLNTTSTWTPGEFEQFIMAMQAGQQVGSQAAAGSGGGGAGGGP